VAVANEAGNIITHLQQIIGSLQQLKRFRASGVAGSRRIMMLLQ